MGGYILIMPIVALIISLLALLKRRREIKQWRENAPEYDNRAYCELVKYVGDLADVLNSKRVTAEPCRKESNK